MLITFLGALAQGLSAPIRYDFNPSNIVISDSGELTIADGDFLFMKTKGIFKLPTTTDPSYGRHLMSLNVNKEGAARVLAQVMVLWFLHTVSDTTPDDLSQWCFNTHRVYSPTPQILMDFFEESNLFTGNADFVANLLGSLQFHKDAPFQNPEGGDIQNALDILLTRHVAGFDSAPYDIAGIRAPTMDLWALRRAGENKQMLYNFTRFVFAYDFKK